MINVVVLFSFTRTHMRAHARMHTRVHPSLLLSLCTYIHTYVYINTYIHVYAYVVIHTWEQDKIEQCMESINMWEATSCSTVNADILKGSSELP